MGVPYLGTEVISRIKPPPTHKAYGNQLIWVTKTYYCRKSISSMLYVITVSLNTMQTAVSNVALSHNQP